MSLSSYLLTLGKNFLNQLQFLTQNIMPIPFVLGQSVPSKEEATSQHLFPSDGKAGHFFLVSSGPFSNSQQF